MGNASPERQAALAQYGLSVGLAFQTVDDILDFSSTQILGKPVVSDLKEGKVTLPIVYAMEHCYQKRDSSRPCCENRSSDF